MSCLGSESGDSDFAGEFTCSLVFSFESIDFSAGLSSSVEIGPGASSALARKSGRKMCFGTGSLLPSIVM